MISVDTEKRIDTSGGPATLRARFSVGENEIVGLYGRSGAGKTTILRMIAGLTSPDRGAVTVDGETWFDGARGVDLPTQRRPLGYFFQDYALFPNMTVRQNLKYAQPRGGDGGYIDHLLELTGMVALADVRPNRLSGGQKQRVALARALVRRPRILLLDEPLSAVDGATRAKLQDELLRLHRSIGFSAIIASHDVGEIFKLCARVVVINGHAADAARDVVETFARGIVRGPGIIVGRVIDVLDGGEVVVQTGEGILSLPPQGLQYLPGEMVALKSAKNEKIESRDGI